MLTIVVSSVPSDGPLVTEVVAAARAGLKEVDDVRTYSSAKPDEHLVAVVARSPGGEQPASTGQIYDALRGIGLEPIVAAGVLRASREGADRAGTPGRSLFVVPFALDEHQRQEIERFYEEEHESILLEAPDWLRVSRYAVTSCHGAGWTDVVVHDLASVKVLESPEVRRSQSTEWRQRLGGEAYFTSEPRYLLDQTDAT